MIKGLENKKGIYNQPKIKGTVVIEGSVRIKIGK